MYRTQQKHTIDCRVEQRISEDSDLRRRLVEEIEGRRERIGMVNAGGGYENWLRRKRVWTVELLSAGKMRRERGGLC